MATARFAAAAELALREARQAAATLTADRILGIALVADVGHAARLEIEAALVFLHHDGTARASARALAAVSRAMGVVVHEAVDYIRACERVVCALLVLRCTTTTLIEREAFLRAAEELFVEQVEGLPWSDVLRQQLLRAYIKTHEGRAPDMLDRRNTIAV